MKESRILRAFDLFRRGEIFWSPAAVFLFYHSVISPLPLAKFPSFSLALLPLIFRLSSKRSSLKTPFTIPILLILGGGAIGLSVSSNKALSLDAFLSLLCCISLFFMLQDRIESERPMKAALALFCAPAILALILRLAGGPGFLRDIPYFERWAKTSTILISSSWISGFLALGLGVGAGSRRVKASLVALFGAFVGLMIPAGWESLSRFVHRTSILGRYRIWEHALPLIFKENPFAGIGLGLWALKFHPPCPVHPHSSYVELYAHFGILGVAGAAWGAAVLVRETLRILKAEGGFWKSLALGASSALILGCGWMGIWEQVWAGITWPDGSISYLISPLPWVLGAFFVAARRKLDEGLGGGREVRS